MKYRIVLLSALLSIMSGCATWSEQYSEDYKMFLAGRADCSENDKFTVKVPQANGAAPIEITSPAGHCTDIPTPRHSGDVYMPAIANAIGVAGTLGAVYIQSSDNRKIAQRNAEANEIISTNTRLSNQSLFETFSGISDGNAEITGQLITTNESLTTQLIAGDGETEGVEGETADSETSP